MKVIEADLLFSTSCVSCIHIRYPSNFLEYVRVPFLETKNHVRLFWFLFLPTSVFFCNVIFCRCDVCVGRSWTIQTYSSKYDYIPYSPSNFEPKYVVWLPYTPVIRKKCLTYSKRKFTLTPLFEWTDRDFFSSTETDSGETQRDKRGLWQIYKGYSGSMQQGVFFGGLG